MLWHYSCIEELCPHFVRKNGFGVPKTIGITALFRFCGLFPLFFVVLLWFIYALIIIQNSNFEPVFHPLFYLSKFLLQKKLQNRLRDSAGWLWGYHFICIQQKLKHNPKNVFPPHIEHCPNLGFCI